MSRQAEHRDGCARARAGTSPGPGLGKEETVLPGTGSGRTCGGQRELEAGETGTGRVR